MEDDEDSTQQMVQSAYLTLRAAILNQQKEGPSMIEINQKLDQILSAVQQQEEPEEDSEPADDPEPEQNAGNKFADIFSFLIK